MVRTAKKYRLISTEQVYRHVVNKNICNAVVFQVLTQTSNRDPVAANARHVADIYIVGSGLDGNAVIAALIDEI